METKKELQQELARLKELVKQTEEKINNVLEVGKWYHYEGGLFCFQGLKDGILRGYGFLNYHNKWTDECNLGVRPNLWKLASHQEVEQALIKEAEKRGFKEGITVSREWAYFNKIVGLENEKYRLFDNKSLALNGWEIFRDGKWAQIITEPEYKDGDIVVATIGNTEYIIKFKGYVEHGRRKIEAHNFISNVGDGILTSGAFDSILRHATDEEKELFNNLANPKPKIGDVCKFWDYFEHDFVIGVCKEIRESCYYATNDEGFKNATPITQQQAIDLLFNS